MTVKSALSIVMLSVFFLVLTIAPVKLLHAATCIDPSSDSDGDGWGYENGVSCTVDSSVAGSAVECIDYDGDGWGWNGLASCVADSTVLSDPSSTGQPDNLSNNLVGECIDNDGDGWGWDGAASCVIPAPSSTAAPAAEVLAVEPVVQVQVSDAPAELTTSCTTILSPGINLYSAILSNSGSICLRPGTYSLPDTLLLNNNQTLIALDPSNPPVLSTSAVRTLSTTGRSNVTIDSVIIDGNGTGAIEFAVIVGNGSNNINLNNVVIRNTVGIGIGIANAVNVSIKGGSITNIGQDTRLRQAIWTAFNSRNVRIDGMSVRGRENDRAGGDHAITCIDSTGFSVNNSRSEWAGSGAVAINNCSNITVTNNELHNGREHGVDIVNGSVGAIVTGNNITGFDRSAMVFDDHDWTCGAGCGDNPTEVRVSNNRMSGNNLVNLARCKGIAVDSQMVINPSPQQLNSDWIQITADNQIDSDSALYCQHIH